VEALAYADVSLTATLTGLQWEHMDGPHGASDAAASESAIHAVVWRPFSVLGSRTLSQTLANMTVPGSACKVTVTDSDSRQLHVDLLRFEAHVDSGHSQNTVPLSVDVRCRIAAGDSVRLLQDALGIPCIAIEWQGWYAQSGWLPFDPLAAASLSKSVSQPGTESTDESFLVVHAPQKPMMQIKVKTFSLAWRNKDGR
jgi:hypothetical protein